MNLHDYVKEKFNLTYNRKQLLLEAFTHSSFVNEHAKTSDYERLEFVGDAVLELWVTKKLYQFTPEIDEGKMTFLRAQLVCEKSCASYLRKLDLQQFIRLGVGEEGSNGRERDSLLCDVFEAFIGSIFIDQGYDKCSEILENTIVVTDDIQDDSLVDYKSRLQEYVQAESRKVLEYRVISSTGPSNNPLFEIGVWLDDIMLGKGSEHSKKKAEQLAAKEAIKKLVK